MATGNRPFTYRVAPQWALNLEGPSPDVPAVGVNSRGEVHVLTRSFHPVLVFDRNGRFMRSWGEGVFGVTHGLHIGPDDCVYVVDLDHTVRKFSPSGELLLTLGVSGAASDTGYRDGDHRTVARGGPPFNSPTGVAVGPSNQIYVSDGYGNAAVHRFSERGEHIGSWGQPGREPGQFRTPHHVFVDGGGTVYVADRENDRIQLFSPDGEFRAEWTGCRRPDAVFVTPDGVAYIAEMGYVAGVVGGMPLPTRQTPSSRVTMRDLDGAILGTLGSDEGDPKTPCAPGNFFAAHGIWVDVDGSLYVGEVIAASAPRDENDGLGWIPPGCHALQAFHPA